MSSRFRVLTSSTGLPDSPLQSGDQDRNWRQAPLHLVSPVLRSAAGFLWVHMTNIPLREPFLSLPANTFGPGFVLPICRPEHGSRVSVASASGRCPALLLEARNGTCGTFRLDQRTDARR